MTIGFQCRRRGNVKKDFVKGQRVRRYIRDSQMSTFYRKPGSPRLISSPNRSLSPRYMRDEEDMDANGRETGNMAGKMKMGVRSRSSNNFKVDRGLGRGC